MTSTGDQTMGYSHRYRGSLTQKQFEDWSIQCKKLCKAVAKTDIKIGGGDGESNRPEFSKEFVWFNGVGEDAYEGFSLEVSQAFVFDEFCKTDRKPYDLLVCACLIALKFTNPDHIEIVTDGDSEDWAEAIALYQQVTGIQVNFEEIVGDKD
jgi:hypothetical protein